MENDDYRDSADERAVAADYHREQMEELREEQLNEMVAGYVTCALWAGLDWSRVNDEDPDADTNPIPWDDNYGVEDIADSAMAHIKGECREFLAHVREHFNGEEDPFDTWVSWGRGWDTIGHDFYLTRNGHGAGFWDRFSDGGEREILGRHLSDAAVTWGESNFYIDGAQLHVED